MPILQNRGFTVIDIMIAIAIVAIMGAAVMPIVNGLGILFRGVHTLHVRQGG